MSLLYASKYCDVKNLLYTLRRGEYISFTEIRQRLDISSMELAGCVGDLRKNGHIITFYRGLMITKRLSKEFVRNRGDRFSEKKLQDIVKESKVIDDLLKFAGKDDPQWMTKVRSLMSEVR